MGRSESVDYATHLEVVQERDRLQRDNDSYRIINHELGTEVARWRGAVKVQGAVEESRRWAIEQAIAAGLNQSKQAIDFAREASAFTLEGVVTMQNEADTWSYLTGLPVKSVRREAVSESLGVTVDGHELQTSEKIVLEIEGDDKTQTGYYTVNLEGPQISA